MDTQLFISYRSATLKRQLIVQ